MRRDANCRLLAALACSIASVASAGIAADWKASPEGANARALAHHRAGSRLYAEAKYAQAIEELKLSLQFRPGQVRVHRLLGISYQLLDKLSEADNAFVQATRIAPKDFESWFFLGRVCYSENFFDRAAEALRNALRLNPTDVRAREHLALTLEATGETDRALDEYERALRGAAGQRKPSWTLHLAYGGLLCRLRQYERCEGHLVAARDLNDHWQVWFELGKLHYATGKLEAAVGDLNASQRAPGATAQDRVRIYRLLGRVYYTMGRDEDAREALMRAEKPEP